MKVKQLLRKVLFWLLAFFITISAAVYQRITGPTQPLVIKYSDPTETYKFSLPRSHTGETDCSVEITLPDRYTGEIVYRQFPTNDPWDTIQLHRVNDHLIAFLPYQPPAGKLEYHLNLYENGTAIELGLEKNIIIRFKGNIPNWVLIPHVLFMFLAMLWSNSTGIQAAANIKSYRRNAIITASLFIIGGLILGPIVQKYAFGVYRTVWPPGEDLIGNRVLVSVILWVIVILLDRKKDRRWLIVVAALLLFFIYMIPNRMSGSELNFETGGVITGIVVSLMTVNSYRFKEILAKSTMHGYFRRIIRSIVK